LHNYLATLLCIVLLSQKCALFAYGMGGKTDIIRNPAIMRGYERSAMAHRG
jgi:hypothetical protein